VLKFKNKFGSLRVRINLVYFIRKAWRVNADRRIRTSLLLRDGWFFLGFTVIWLECQVQIINRVWLKSQKYYEFVVGYIYLHGIYEFRPLTAPFSTPQTIVNHWWNVDWQVKTISPCSEKCMPHYLDCSGIEPRFPLANIWAVARLIMTSTVGFRWTPGLKHFYPPMPPIRPLPARCHSSVTGTLCISLHITHTAVVLLITSTQRIILNSKTDLSGRQSHDTAVICQKQTSWMDTFWLDSSYPRRQNVW
jgi:hypothetical protein